ENELLVALKVSAFELPTDKAPLVLDSVTVPVLIAATVPPSVSVEPPNEMVSCEAPDTAKAPRPMLRPSVVDRVIEFLALVVVKDAAMPVVPATALVAQPTDGSA